jgi:hypothetical protein
MIDRITDGFIWILLPFLVVSGLALLVLLVCLVIQRMVDEVQFQYRQRTTRHYRPLINALLVPNAPREVVEELARAPRSARPVLARMLLAPLGVATGAIVEQVREAARVLGFVDEWTRLLSHRRWWDRAEAARALGLVREPRVTTALVRALDDEHEEVRAAAVGALGLVGDKRAIPDLLIRLPDQSRHQRARIVDALCNFGDQATPALVEHGRAHPEDVALIVDVLGLTGGSAAIGELARYLGDRRPEVRAAVLRALGNIGLDDSTYGAALAALEDSVADVRGMAARALGRSMREDSAQRLALHLDDEWIVAAHCAYALRRFGTIGPALLQARTTDRGYAGQLARQMLWEHQAAQQVGA